MPKKTKYAQDFLLLKRQYFLAKNKSMKAGWAIIDQQCFVYLNPETLSSSGNTTIRQQVYAKAAAVPVPVVQGLTISLI